MRGRRLALALVLLAWAVASRAESLAGADVNRNGVRDDVDAYIAARFQSGPQRQAAAQMAAVYQAVILVPKSDQDAVRQLALRSARAVHCVYATFTADAGDLAPGAVMNALRRLTMNTTDRSKAYQAFSKALNGSVSTSPMGDTCESSR